MQHNLSAQDIEKIKRAAAKAEALTGGDIVTVIDPRAQRIHAQHLAIVLVGVISFFSLIWYATAVNRALLESWLFGAIMIVLFIDVVFYVYRYLGQSERALSRQHYVRVARSLFQRRQRQLANGRPLVLFYVSVDGRHAEIVADKSLLGTINPMQWQEAVNAFTTLAAQGKTVEAFIKGIHTAVQLLQRYVPAKGHDADQVQREMAQAANG